MKNLVKVLIETMHCPKSTLTLASMCMHIDILLEPWTLH